jgi:hypothetical protein
MWTYVINDVKKPSLNRVCVNYTLFKDDERYITTEIYISVKELASLDNKAKEALIKERIEADNVVYVQTDEVTAALQTLVAFRGTLSEQKIDKDEVKRLFTEEVKKLYTDLFTTVVTTTPSLDIKEA